MCETGFDQLPYELVTEVHTFIPIFVQIFYMYSLPTIQILLSVHPASLQQCRGVCQLWRAIVDKEILQNPAVGKRRKLKCKRIC